MRIKIALPQDDENGVDICCQGYDSDQHSKGFSQRLLFIQKLLIKKKRINMRNKARNIKNI